MTLAVRDKFGRDIPVTILGEGRLPATLRVRTAGGQVWEVHRSVVQPSRLTGGPMGEDTKRTRNP